MSRIKADYAIAPPWILRRYLAWEYLRWFIFCVIGFDAILVVVTLFEKAGTFLDHHASYEQVMRYTLYMLPEFVTYMIAPSALIAMLIAISGMTRRNEVTAILAGGIGRRTIVAPMALIAGLMSILQFAISEYVVPEANAQKNYVMDVEISGEQRTSDRRNHWFFIDGGFLRVGVIDRRTHPGGPPDVTLHEVLYLKAADPDHPPVRIEAGAAQWDPAGKHWLLVDGKRTVLDSAGMLTIVPSSGQALDVALAPGDLTQRVAEAEEWGVADLKKVIHDRERLGQSVVKETVDLHQRFALPLAALVMGLLGAPFAFREHRRGGAAAGIAIGMLIGLSYFLVLATSLSFGKSGQVPPIVAAWLPNAVFGGAGLYLTATLDLL